MSKKTFYLAVFIALTMFLACSCQNKQYNSEEDFEVEIYSSSEGVIITKYTGKSKNVKIPQYIQNLPVVSIAERAFYDKKLTSVTIPESVTYIGWYAFARNRLTNILIPGNIRQINIYAFADNQLTSVIIPDSIGIIGEGAFYKNRLKNVILPASRYYIGDLAFAMNQLKSIVFLDGLYSIGTNAFADNQLTSVIIPEGISDIWEASFARNNLTSVTIPDSVFYIDKFAFSSNQLININISGKIKIDTLAFDNEFAGFYLRNGSKAGKYTYKNGKWEGKFIKKPTTDPVIDGVYEITAAYSHIYNHVFSGDAFREIETEKLGLLVTINNYKATFEDIEYEINEGNGYSSRTKDNLLEYEDFRRMSEGMNYGWFDENIIGKEYTGKVKAMTMINNENSYYIFFADNKLIIMIDTEKHETEFKRLIRAKGLDTFFYIAEKVIE